jgi:hypothetical protein
MHKFVERSRVWIFRNKHTRSTLLDQSLCFGVFWTFSLLHEIQCKIGRTGAINAQVHVTNSRWKFPQRTHPILPIGPQTHVLGRFRSFCYSTNFCAKEAEQVPLMQKFVEQSRIGIFRNERTRSSPLDPKLMFWGVSNYFVTAPTWCKWAELVLLMHKLLKQSCIKIFRNESTRSTPFGPKLMFCGVSDRFVIAWTSVQNMPNLCH